MTNIHLDVQYVDVHVHIVISIQYTHMDIIVFMQLCMYLREQLCMVNLNKNSCFHIDNKGIPE